MKIKFLLISGSLLFYLNFPEFVKCQTMYSEERDKEPELYRSSSTKELKDIDENGNNISKNKTVNPNIRAKPAKTDSTSEANFLSKFTHIEYEVKEDGLVKIYLLNQQDISLGVIVNRFHKTGVYTALFNAEALRGETYYYRVTINDKPELKKPLIIK
jgi:hypothetical protein